MGGKLTDVAEATVLSSLFRGSVAISLHTADPTEDGFINELEGVGYERQYASFTIPELVDGHTVQSNLTTVTFTCTEGTWSTVSHIGLANNSFEVSYAQLTTPLTAAATEEIVFPPGSIEHTLD